MSTVGSSYASWLLPESVSMYVTCATSLSESPSSVRAIESTESLSDPKVSLLPDGTSELVDERVMTEFERGAVAQCLMLKMLSSINTETSAMMIKGAICFGEYANLLSYMPSLLVCVHCGDKLSDASSMFCSRNDCNVRYYVRSVRQSARVGSLEISRSIKA